MRAFLRSIRSRVEPIIEPWVFKILKKFRMQKAKTDLFHILYYGSFKQTWYNTFWMGVRVEKNPMDLWIYQEILFELKPDYIIECGTFQGGSAYYLASICDLIGNGQVITIDIEEKPNRPVHPRITYLLGSSTSPEIVARVEEMIKDGGKIMVILDSDHTMKHVLNELNIYSKLVSKNSYIVVEDSNMNFHPVPSFFGPGPMEAIDQFMKGPAKHQFIIDKTKEKFMLTFFPRGFLKRIG